MTDPSAPQDEMAESRFRSRPGFEPEEPLLDMILDGYPLPPDAPRELHTLAAGLGGLTRGAPGRRGPLTGEEAAFAAFRQAAGHSAPAPARASRPAHREARTPLGRRPLLAAVRVRLVAISAAAAIAVGGTAAAYAGVLPAALQDFAHTVIGAPAGGNGHNSQLPGSPQPTVSPGAGSAGSGAAGHGPQSGQRQATSGTGHGHQPGRPAHAVSPTPQGKTRRPGTPQPSSRPTPNPSATPGLH